MLINYRSIKSLLLFCACLFVPFSNIAAADVQKYVNQPLNSPYTMSAKAYLDLAKNQTGVEQQSLLITAAGRLIYEARWHDALTILSKLNDLPIDLNNEKKILLAKIDLINEQPKFAILKLSKIDDLKNEPIYYQAQYHEILALAYQEIGNSKEALVERIKLESILPDDISKDNNRRALWLILTKMPVAELSTIALEATPDSILEGWMQLALIARKNYLDPASMLSQIERWQDHYPSHPGNFILSSSLNGENLYSQPKQIALLLPLTGQLMGPGEAIKDGFLAALKEARMPVAPKVLSYDTNATKIEDLYSQALAEGANFVVGPLDKANVTKIAGINHPVPTLLLNDVDKTPAPHAYQFGLSPISEARQVATKARKNGFSKALVIVPEGPWGEDLRLAFANQWGANGGYIIDALHYGSNDDLNKSMRNFLKISDSESNGKAFKKLIGLQTTPSRRQDFDVIFLVAYPSKAREIMPLLKYYYAGDVPVYATSSVYSGVADATKDKDLDGIIFCDLPWVFSHQTGSRNWPEQLNSYNRLYALGMDSFTLLTQLNQLLLFPAIGVNDKSGVIYLTNSQKIARILDWGQFKQGIAVKMGDKPSV